MNEENYLQESQYTQTPFTVSPLSSTKSVALRIHTFCTPLGCAGNSRHFVLSHLVHCSLCVTLHTVTLHSSTFFAVPQRNAFVCVIYATSSCSRTFQPSLSSLDKRSVTLSFSRMVWQRGKHICWRDVRNLAGQSAYKAPSPAVSLFSLLLIKSGYNGNKIECNIWFSCCV